MAKPKAKKPKVALEEPAAVEPTAVQLVDNDALADTVNDAVEAQFAKYFESESRKVQAAAAASATAAAPAVAAAPDPNQQLMAQLLQLTNTVVQTAANQSSSTSSGSFDKIPAHLRPAVRRSQEDVKAVFRRTTGVPPKFKDQALDALSNAVPEDHGRLTSNVKAVVNAEKSELASRALEELDEAYYGMYTDCVFSLVQAGIDAFDAPATSRGGSSSRSSYKEKSGYCFVCVSKACVCPQNFDSFFSFFPHYFIPIFFSTFLLLFQLHLLHPPHDQFKSLHEPAIAAAIWASSLSTLCGFFGCTTTNSLSQFFQLLTSFDYFPSIQNIRISVHRFLHPYRVPETTGSTAQFAHGPKSLDKSVLEPTGLRIDQTSTRESDSFPPFLGFPVLEFAASQCTLPQVQRTWRSVLRESFTPFTASVRSPSLVLPFLKLKHVVPNVTFMQQFNQQHANAIVADKLVKPLTTFPTALSIPVASVAPKRFLRQPLGLPLSAAPDDARTNTRDARRRRKAEEAARIREIVYAANGSSIHFSIPVISPGDLPEVEEFSDISNPRAPHMNVQSHLAFWERIGAPPQVLNLIKNGAPADIEFPLPANGIHMIPYKLEEADSIFINSELTRLEQQGTIQFVKTKPLVTCGLFTVEKIKGNGAISKRMCVNFVPLNAFTKSRSFHVESIETLVRLLKQEDCLLIYDLTDAFFHVMAGIILRNLLGFETEDGRYGIFLATCFGWTNSPYWFHLLIITLVYYWRKAGKRCSSFGDDIIFAVNKHVPLRSKLHILILTDLKDAGFQVNVSKSQIEVLIGIYIGYILDMNTYRLLIKVRRLKKILERGAALLLQTETSCRELARFSSSIMSTAPVLGSTAALYTQEINIWLGQHLDGTYSGWDKLHPLSSHVRTEIQFWITFMKSNPSRPLWTAHFVRHIVVATDASATGLGGTMYIPGSDLVAASLTLSQCQDSSTHREIYGAELLNKIYVPKLSSKPEWILVTHLLDSNSAVQILSRGSTIRVLLNIAKAMDQRARNNHVMVNYGWHPRTDTLAEHADLLSRLADRDIYDYELRSEVFLQIALYVWHIYHLAPSVDLFASMHNTKCPIFYSFYMQPGSSGANVLIHDLPFRLGSYYYACPPIPLISTFLTMLPLLSPVLLIVPKFSKQPYMTTLFPQDEQPPFTFDLMPPLSHSSFRPGPIGTHDFITNPSSTANFLVLFIHPRT